MSYCEGWYPSTDLALEMSEILKKQESDSDELEGVCITEEKEETFDILTTRVSILNETGSQKMGKPKGEYITIECEAMKENSPDAHYAIIRVLTHELETLLPQKDKKEMQVLVIGLGNRFATPDRLGPQVTNKVLVTRHLKSKAPDEIDESICQLSSLAPGVMGLTGIETAEIISAVSEKVKPDCIIAIDALAARDTRRINTTIQMTNTGISPGAGVGNKRKQLNEETVGCPVIAIGVPTVVETVTLVHDAFEQLISSMLEQAEHSPLYDMLESLTTNEMNALIRETLIPQMRDLFVTPKEIDEVIDYLSTIIANAINIAAHPGMSLEDINKYTY